MQEIKQLISGHQRFHKKYFEDQPAIYQPLFEQGQRPQFIVIACCDSRVSPDQIMDTMPGDIFVIRNVANLVPLNEIDGKLHGGTIAAIEFAVKHLKVKHIIVLGHSQCGGIKSLMEEQHLGHDYQFIDPWMALAKSAKETVIHRYADKTFAQQCTLCEQESIKISLNNLLTFPWIKENVDAQQLFIHGWYFDIATGRLLGLQDDQFLPVNA